MHGLNSIADDPQPRAAARPPEFFFHKNDIGDVTPHYLSAIDTVLKSLRGTRTQ